MKKIILFVLAIILSACAGVSDYDQNLAKWQGADISHYRFQLFIGCFCPFGEDMPLTIEVKDGEVVSMNRFDGSPVESTDPSFEVYNAYSTIDRIFVELAAEQNGDADEVLVEYDTQYGFPANVAIDNIKEAIDDEFSFQVSNFEVLE